MLIYFVDGSIRDNSGGHIPVITDWYWRVDASEGYSSCVNVLDELLKHSYDDIVLTNFIGALAPKYSFDGSTKTFNIFFVSGNESKWVSMYDLIDKNTTYQSCSQDCIFEQMFKQGICNVKRPMLEKIFEDE